MEESIEQKRKRIMGKQFLIKYIDSLNEILIKDASAYTLLSIVETDFFYLQVDYEKGSKVHYTILFSERIKLKDLLKNHSIDFEEEFILWVEYADNCGALKMNSLNEFNFEFSYDVSKNGIITLTQIGYKYQILLDFYEDNYTKYLDVEIFYEIKR